MGWRTDWLYKIIFDRARYAWNDAEHLASQLATPISIQRSLDRMQITHYMNADFDQSVCREPIRRRWMFDGKVFLELPIAGTAGTNYARKDADINSERVAESPFIARRQVLHQEGRFDFCISPDRKRVVVSYVLGPLFGRGYSYLVTGQGRNGKLTFAPGATGWIS